MAADDLPPLIADPDLAKYLRALQKRVEGVAKDGARTRTTAKIAASKAASTSGQASALELQAAATRAELTVDRTPPAKPTTAPALTVETYWAASSGEPRARILVDWDEVTTNTNGDPAAAAEYEMWHAVSGQELASAGRAVIRYAMNEDEATVIVTPMGTIENLSTPGTHVVAIRARSATGIWGELSPAEAVEVAFDMAAPAAPSAPTLSTIGGTVSVYWDGEMEAGGPAGPEIAFARILISETSGGTYTPAATDTIRGNGGASVITDGLTIGSTYFFKLELVDRIGQTGAMSAPGSIAVEGVDLTELESDVAAAAAAAAAASTAAADAQADADNALSTAYTAVSVADSKAQIYYQDDAPVGIVPIGSTWFDTNDGNRIRRWNGAMWVDNLFGGAAVADGAITATQISSAVNTAISNAQSTASSAQTAANGAQVTADGKNAVYFQATAPTGTAYKFNDTWFDTDDGNRIYRWPGGSGPWTAQQFGSNALATGAVTATQLASNAVTAVKIANGVVDSTKLATAVNTSISNAQSTATAAQTAATNASTAASTAQAAANTAQSAAGAAQSAADAAATAAADAAGIANGKGKVLVQSAAPGAADRNTVTLWIDTTGGANTPKRWSSGTTWVAVTDKAATDAAAAAAAAQTSANNASTAASAAQSTANTATTIANAAQTAADAAQLSANAAATAATAAQTTANGKNKIVRSTADASSPGSYVAGDQWWKYSGSQITAMWIHSGSAWVSQTLTDSVITNLNAGSITAGFLAAARIQANTITGTHIAGATVTAANMVAGTITAASGILANASVGNAQIIDAAITNAKIADATIQNAKIATLDAAKISTGYLAAARIAAGSLSVGKLTVADMTNLLDDPDFSRPFGETWQLITGTAWTIGTDGTEPGNVISHTATGVQHRLKNLNRIRVKVGDTFRFKLRALSTLNNPAYVSLMLRDNAGTYLSATDTVIIPAGGWSDITGVLSVPLVLPNMQFADFEIAVPTTATTGSLSISKPQWLRMSTGELIVDGQITAAKMVVGTITAASGIIADAAITSAKIANLAVTNAHIADATIQNAKIANLDAAKISTGYLAAARIAANTITGTMIAGTTIVAGNMAANSIAAAAIQSGAVTTVKLDAGAVTTAKLAAGAVTANELSAGAVTAGKISATAIDGMTITGALVQTVATANRGVKIDSSGIKAYNSSGVLKASIDASTGVLTASDGIFTGIVNATGGTISGGLDVSGELTATSSGNKSIFRSDWISTERTSLTGAAGTPAGVRITGGDIQIRSLDGSGGVSSRSGRLDSNGLLLDNPFTPGAGEKTYTIRGRGGQIQLVSTSPASLDSGESGLILGRYMSATVVSRVGNQSAALVFGGAFNASDIEANQITLSAGAAATATSTNHALQIGNMVADGSKFLWRDGSGGVRASVESKIDGSLTLGASVVKVANPAFLVTRNGSTSPSFANATWTQVTAWATPDLNRETTSWSSGALTIKHAGLYDISIGANFSTGSSTAGRIMVAVTKNSTTVDAGVIVQGNLYGVNQTKANNYVVLAAGDVLRFFAMQQTGETRTLTNEVHTYLSVIYSGA